MPAQLLDKAILLLTEAPLLTRQHPQSSCERRIVLDAHRDLGVAAYIGKAAGFTTHISDIQRGRSRIYMHLSVRWKYSHSELPNDCLFFRLLQSQICIAILSCSSHDGRLTAWMCDIILSKNLPYTWMYQISTNSYRDKGK